jgi:hypothetical protein
MFQMAEDGLFDVRFGSKEDIRSARKTATFLGVRPP